MTEESSNDVPEQVVPKGSLATRYYLNKLPYRSINFLIGFTIVTIFTTIYYVNSFQFRSLLVTSNNPTIEPPQSCPTSGIFLQDAGQFGNVFFEYLQARIISEYLGGQLFIRYALAALFQSYFVDVKASAYPSLQFLEQVCLYNTSTFQNIGMNDIHHVDSPSGDRHSHILLAAGYLDEMPPIMWKVLLASRNDFIGEFQWQPELKWRVESHISQLVANQSFDPAVLVGIHNRMPDLNEYVNHSYTAVKVPGEIYFNRAMNYYRQKYTRPLFVVVSNNMAHCRQTIQGPDVIFAGNDEEHDPGWDLALLTSCHHLILTYGSFGLTAAYFMAGQGEVLAPDNFTSVTNSMSENIRQAQWPNWTWVNID